MLKRPLLVGGLGLSFGLWAWDAVQQPFGDVDGGLLGGTIAIGAGLWLWRRWRSPAIIAPPLTPWQPVTAAELQTAFQQIEDWVERLATELAAHPDHDPVNAAAILADWRAQALALQAPDPDSVVIPAPLQVSLMGQPQTGKTTLMQVLSQQAWPLPLTWTEITVGAPDAADPTPTDRASCASLASDLVVFLVNGDLLASEQAAIQALIQQRQRVLVLLNKHDHYAPAERLVILDRIRTRLAPCLATTDIGAIAAAPRPIKRRQHHADGQVTETVTQPAPDCQAAIAPLHSILAESAAALTQATTWRRAQALRRALQHEINTYRRDRALPVIEQYQWLAGAAAFANPVPSLDMVATAAISAQLVMDLGVIYQQPFTTAQAKELAGTLASQMMQLGVVELSTQALSVALKGTAVTFVAGGLLQGLSAAYLTRLAGLSLVEFFAAQSLQADGQPRLPSLDQVGPILQQTVQRFRQGDGLKLLVQQGLKAWGAASPVRPRPAV